MTDKKKNEPQDDQPDDQDEIISQSSEPKSQVDQIIEDWQEEARQLNISTHATLYKYDSMDTGNSNIFYGYYNNEQIPNRHEIGLKFGSGRYKITLNQPKATREKRHSTTIVFRIGKIYDEYKAAAEEEKRQAAAQQFKEAKNNGTDSFLMVERLLGKHIY